MNLETKRELVVCQEVFTDGDEPTNEEICQFARTLGIDLERETHLIHLARDGLMQPLPPNWVPCFDKERNAFYYFNTKSELSQFEHPLDAVYKSLVKKARLEGPSTSDQFDEDSRTSIKEDLKSFEEIPITPPSRSQSEMLPRPRLLAPLGLGSTNALRKTPILSPLKPNEKEQVATKKVSFDCEVRKRPNSSDIRNRRNIGPVEFQNFSKLVATRNSRDEGYGTEPSASSLTTTDGKKELTLSGGGEVFLKKTPLKSLHSDEADDSFKSKDDSFKEKHVPIKLEKEIKVQFEVPQSKLDKNIKQIEIDFDDLKIDLEDINFSSQGDTNLIKKINESSQNLIDLSDSNSSIDSQGVLVTNEIKSNVKLNGIAARKRFFELSVDQKASKALSHKNLDDLLKGDEGSSDSERKIDCEQKQKEVKLRFEAAKADKLKMLEGEFNAWVKSIEKSFKEKENAYMNNIKERHEDWRKNKENELIKRASEQAEECLQNKLEELKRELNLKEEQALRDLQSSLLNEQKMRLDSVREEFRIREEREILDLKNSLNEALEAKKVEILRKHKEDVDKLEFGIEVALNEQRMVKDREEDLRRNHETSLQVLKVELNDTYEKQRVALQRQHEQSLAELRNRNEAEIKQEELIHSRRKTYSKEFHTDPRLFEKLRCEKRLLEDKYSTLKDKYTRLKTDVKLTLGKKKKKDSASETDKSTTVENAPSNPLKEDDDTVQARVKKKEVIENEPAKFSIFLSPNERRRSKMTDHDVDISSDDEDKQLENSKKRRQLFSKYKASSTSKLDVKLKSNEKEDSLSPVENLRRQLKKLEELEDQFPVTTHTDMYLRYPFSDTPEMQFGSSDFEFFKHRIHLERDSVKRAKEFLKTQKKCFESRQLELQRRLQSGRPKSIVDQIYKEEKELTEMEVSVHRTRSLLGEKIIRLRHLEQSLLRIQPDGRKFDGTQDAIKMSNMNDGAGTLSDLSSHSDSSGFSSTHHTSDHHPVGFRPSIERRVNHPSHHQEPSEIIHSLEKLNTEIRGIWDVLKQQQTSSSTKQPPPTSLHVPPTPTVRTNPQHAIPRPLLFTHHVASSGGHVTTFGDSSLADRTRSLRDWLKVSRHAPYVGHHSTDHPSTSQQQVTL